MKGVLRIVSGIMALLFLLALVVQYNDPDPIPWMVIYGAATAACLLVVVGRGNRKLAGITGVVALAWMLMLVPRVLGQVAPGEMFREAGMATLEIEEAREALGLGLVATWMAVLWFTSRPQHARR